MYFRAVPFNETEHRRTLFTNANFPLHQHVDLPVGHFTPATARDSVNTVLVYFTERLEAVRPDGTDEFMVSTGGDSIADDLAIVLSFALDATFTPVHRKAVRLITAPSGTPHAPTPSDILPRTFTPQLVLHEVDLNDLRSFMTSLLRLNRGVYEKAIRAMRRIVTASERVADDPTLAYTDYVAALESLSAGFDATASEWDRLDPRKRRILDPALDSLSPEDRERIRAAVLDSERAGIKNRYVEFVLSHVRPSFFREEACVASRPVRRTSLRQVVAKAYDARSKNMHELHELDIGTWLLVGGAHTVTVPGASLMLTHAGLNSLARHVVRTYIERGSTVLDNGYQWRDHLPTSSGAAGVGVLLGNAEAMTPSAARPVPESSSGISLKRCRDEPRSSSTCVPR